MNSFFSENELNQLGLKSYGSNVMISRKASIYGASEIEIGNNVRIDDFCILSGRILIKDYVHISAAVIIHGDNVGVEIGNFCNISGNTSFYAASDDYSGETLTSPLIPEKYKKIFRKKIVLGDYTIIGANCVVLPGVNLGEGCSVGAMSLINKSLAEWTINCGIPCRKIKNRSKNLLKVKNEFLSETQDVK